MAPTAGEIETDILDDGCQPRSAISDDPDMFRLDRLLNQSKRHLSFGYSVHFCLGAPIARLEAQIGLRTLVERLPNLRLTGETERIDSWNYWGQRKLPVAWAERAPHPSPI